MITRRLFTGSVAATALGGAWARTAQAGSTAIKAATGEVVLTVDGKVSVTNAPGCVQFDMAMLEAMPKAVIETSTPWTAGKARFEGVLLTDILAITGARGTTIRASALNDYSVDLPVEDAARYKPIVAFRLNGQYMPVREKGPLWIMYPFDSDTDLRTETIYSRAVWQLHSLTVS